MGGLATAALLARAGLRPLVIERADTVGGRGRMRPYRGYRLPVAVRIYGKRAIDALLARLGLTFDFAPIHSPILAFYLTRRRRYLPLPDDLLAGYVDLFAAMGIGRRQARAIGSALAAWVRVPAEEIARLIRTGTAFSEFVRRQVKDPALRRLLFNVTTWVGHGIPDPRRLSAGQFLEKFVFPITEREQRVRGRADRLELLDHSRSTSGITGGECGSVPRRCGRVGRPSRDRGHRPRPQAESTSACRPRRGARRARLAGAAPGGCRLFR
jgi:hypothetical protein